MWKKARAPLKKKAIARRGSREEEGGLCAGDGAGNGEGGRWAMEGDNLQCR